MPSSVFDFGIRARKGGTAGTPMWTYFAAAGDLLAVYQSGYIVAGYGTGDNTWVGALFTDGFYVDRVEWWRGSPVPGNGGTILAADDLAYTDRAAMLAAGWSSWRGGPDSVGGGYAGFNGGTVSTGATKPTPAGADCCILRGCYFMSVPPDTWWGMVSLHHGNGPSSNGGDYGEGGQRVLVRRATPFHPEADFGSLATIPEPSVGVRPPLRQRQKLINTPRIRQHVR